MYSKNLSYEYILHIMTENNLRILYTTAWYPNRKNIGDGVFIKKHADAISSINDVVVLLVQTDNNINGLHIDVETYLHSKDFGSLKEVFVYIPRINFEIPFLTTIIRFLWFIVGSFIGYRKAIELWNGKKPQICHINVLTRAGFLPYILYKFYHIPYIITEHWSRYGTGAFPNSKLQLFLTRLIVHSASYVCPVSHNLKNDMLKWGLNNDNYQFVNNIVDTNVFKLSPHLTAINTKKRFIHISWMRDEAKNISGILRVLHKLSTVRNDFEMVFIGDGNDKDYLIQYANKLNLILTGYVSFAGHKQGQELASYMANFDYMLMFSNYENQPVSILEALSVGLPVIATNVGIINQLLVNNRGLLVEPQNEDMLFNTLVETLNKDFSPNTVQEMLSRHQYIVRNYSPKVVASNLQNLYNYSLKNV